MLPQIDQRGIACLPSPLPSPPASPPACPFACPPGWLPPPRTELQAGLFAEHALREWPACTEYYLVDIWAQQVRSCAVLH